MVVISVSGDKNNSKDIENDNYDVKTNEVGEHGNAANKKFQLIKDGAVKTVDSPDLSKVGCVIFF